jgi:hypothetical protein
MLFVDIKYITTVGFHLRNFKKKKNNLYNCSCPICGDSERNKTKARGYFYQKGNSMNYRCHNCLAGMAISSFLKINFPNYYDQYILEKYKSSSDSSFTVKTTTRLISEKIQKDQLSSDLKRLNEISQSIANLPNEHYAKQYVINRKIPCEYFNVIFFTDNFSKLIDDIFPGRYDNLVENEPRLVIPFFDKNELIGLQGRSFSPNKKLRYITIRKDEGVNLIFGIDRFNTNSIGYVVEGPIDSLFLPNSIAAANSDLESVLDKIPHNNDLVLVFDNEPKNKEILKLMESAIQHNKKICIWSTHNTHKDINDMILSGRLKDDILNEIQRRTFSGLEAQLEFCKWKRI